MRPDQLKTLLQQAMGYAHYVTLRDYDSDQEQKDQLNQYFEQWIAEKLNELK